MKNNIIIIRGAGDVATGIAHRLFNCGFKVLMLEIERPLVVRRMASFAQAVIKGQAIVEGVHARKACNVNDIYKIWDKGSIPVLCDSKCAILNKVKPMVLIDAILAKKNLGTYKGMAPVTIGIGPGFEAGVDVDAVIETKRGHNLGKVIYTGCAEQNTGIPGEIMGYTLERVLRAPASGIIKNVLDIGDTVKAGDVIARVGAEPVVSAVDGVIRGLIMDGAIVSEGLKIGDVDPRGIVEYCYTISEKSRAIAGGVLEAILYMRGNCYERRYDGVHAFYKTGSRS